MRGPALIVVTSGACLDGLCTRRACRGFLRLKAGATWASSRWLRRPPPRMRRWPKEHQASGFAPSAIHLSTGSDPSGPEPVAGIELVPTGHGLPRSALSWHAPDALWVHRRVAYLPLRSCGITSTPARTSAPALTIRRDGALPRVGAYRGLPPSSTRHTCARVIGVRVASGGLLAGWRARRRGRQAGHRPEGRWPLGGWALQLQTFGCGSPEA
jgi:hypothetical protein